MEQVERPEQTYRRADWDDYVNREKAIALAVLGRQAFRKRRSGARPSPITSER
jgi:hypothetical protein